MPNNSILERAARHNPHGFGFCTPQKTYKTLSLKAFMKKIRKIDANEPCILHFRYATTGSVKRANCHPFKEGDIRFVHNGVLRIETRNDMTDSETFFKNDVMPVVKQCGFGSVGLRKFMLERAGYSKFALMKGSEISVYGDFQEIEGCHYSNLRFLNYYM